MRAAFYSLWGVLTLVLVFAVAYMFVRLSQSHDQSGSGGALGEGAAAPRDNSEVGDRPMTRLYFADPMLLRLVAEDRPLPHGAETLENCRAAINALIEGPTAGASPVLPASAHVRALYLLDSGELIVDFTRDIDSPALHSAGAEWLAAQALANTLTQPGIRGATDRPVSSVRLLYEGSPAEESFPGHISLPGPLRPDARLVGE
jgi:hypothetical protein